MRRMLEEISPHNTLSVALCGNERAEKCGLRGTSQPPSSCRCLNSTTVLIARQAPENGTEPRPKKLLEQVSEAIHDLALGEEH